MTQKLCYNEIQTKINWHCLRFDFDLERMRWLGFQCNDQVGVPPSIGITLVATLALKACRPWLRGPRRRSSTCMRPGTPWRRSSSWHRCRGGADHRMRPTFCAEQRRPGLAHGHPIPASHHRDRCKSCLHYVPRACACTGDRTIRDRPTRPRLDRRLAPDGFLCGLHALCTMRTACLSRARLRHWILMPSSASPPAVSST